MVADRAPVDFGLFERSALAERICARFLSLIEEGHLRPGDKLPPERELAITMGVSRPSLREALRALSVMNVVEMRQGDGTYVTSLEPSLLVEHLDFVFSLDDSTFLQLLDARKALEPGIAAAAASRISDQEISELEACLDRTLASMEEPTAFLQADLELHARIAAAAQNPILNRFMAIIGRLGEASRQRTVEIAGIRRQTVIDHGAVVSALKARDPAAAYQAMLQHLDHIQQQLEAVSVSGEG
jgi:GntR family transcriptional repressor for pyruvate dehydrogenase complex